MGRSTELADRFTAESAQLADLEVRSRMAGRWRMASVQMAFSIMPALVYWFAGQSIASGGDAISIGTVVAFTTLQTRLFFPLQSLLGVGLDVQSSLALFHRIFEYLDLEVDILDREDAVVLDPAAVRGDVRFEDVTFGYDADGPPTLDGIDLAVPAGARVAVVGETGSGKTTLGYLVARLYDTTAGRVTIDGVDVRDLSFAALARAVGLVSQETYLFHATIRENLRFAKPDASDEELEAAARAAQIHALIASLPDGYDTVVGERGYRFSGGEKQRIAIARTILRNPPVLVLDEATSALDTETERRLHGALGLGVQRAGRLVEDEHRRVAQDRPRDRDALLLAAREPVAALADHGVVAVGQRGDERVDLRRARRGLELLVARVGLGEAQVVADRRVEQVRLLRDEADRPGQGAEGEVAHVDPVDRHAPGGRVVQPGDEIAERRLARAGLPHHRHARAGRDREVDAVERRRPVRVVAERDVLEAHVAAHRRRVEHDGVLPVEDVDLEVEVLEDAVEEGQRALDVQADAEQRLQREEEPRLQGGEGDHGADRDRLAAGGDALPGEPVDERGHDREGHLHGGHAPAPGHPRAHLEVGELRRLDGEAVGQLGRAPHRLAEQDAADAQRLLDERGDVREPALALGGDPLALAADAAREPDEERQQRQREDGEPPVEREHRHDGGDHRGDAGDDRGGGARHHVLHAADVVGDPRLHLAGARAREEGERQPLQVAVDRRAQVMHDALADDVRQPGLADAEDAGGHRHADHPEDEQREQAGVALRDGLVEHLAQQERRDHAKT